SLATLHTSAASSAVRAKIETQSRDRHAGTTPSVLSRPGVGLRPMMLLQPAGTRPEPAVSLPRAKLTIPAATATADPELDPPEIYAASNTLLQAPYGLRSPASPVANWSRFVLPTRIAPARSSRFTTGAVAS